MKDETIAYSVRIYLEYSDIWHEVQEFAFRSDAIAFAQEISKSCECKVIEKITVITEEEIVY